MEVRSGILEGPDNPGRRGSQFLEGDGRRRKFWGAGSLSALAKACGSWRSLISLLHPDRHMNSRAANSATAYVMQHLPK